MQPIRLTHGRPGRPPAACAAFTLLELLTVITVIATLATMLGAGVPLKEAVQHANRAGGIVVGKLGTAVVTYPELFGAAP